MESYNNYIKAQTLAKDDTDKVILAGEKNQYTFFQNDDGFYFIDENSKIQLLQSVIPYNIYKLNDDVIVCEQDGYTLQCKVYIMMTASQCFMNKYPGTAVYFAVGFTTPENYQ